MAQAESHLKRIDDLDELLRYLEELGYEKYAALWEMERQYLDGVLLLTKREYRSDGTPYGNAIAIDAAYGHIELDRHGRVRVVPRSGFEWREVRYRIAEHCDVRAIWPPRPPASQPAPGAPLPPSHKPTTPSKKQKRKRPTQHDRLVSLMNDLDLKPGMQPHEALRAVKQPYKNKYHNEPSKSAVTRAYDQHEAALTTSTKAVD